MRLFVVVCLAFVLSSAFAEVNEEELVECCIINPESACNSVCTEHSEVVAKLKAIFTAPFDADEFAKEHLAEIQVQDEDGNGKLDVLESDSPSSGPLLVANKGGKKSTSFVEVSVTARNPHVIGTKLWPKGVIPFKYDASVARTSTDIDSINSRWKFLMASGKWEKDTCIQFENEETNADATVFTGTTGACAARVGVGAKRQAVSVGKKSGLSSYLHELGHVIGLLHTNIRSDHETGNNIKFKLAECSADLLASDCSLVSGRCKDTFPSWVRRRDAVCEASDVSTVATNYFNDKYGVAGTTYDKTIPADLHKCRQAVCTAQWLTQYDYPASVPAPPFEGPYDCSNVMHYPRPNDCFEDLANCRGKPRPGTNGLTAEDAKVVNKIYGCNCRPVKFTGASTDKTVTICQHPDWTLAEFLKFSAKQAGFGVSNPFASGFEVHAKGAKVTGAKVKDWGLEADTEIEVKKTV